ncbi:hypothetical protein K466DRAFT_237840 [Polyporus arcularius HHB13444]|uniref:Uncharacterized protein n=1 Tax=Polyporus arcularius HHB13444 TaxID=1314778 RepID=A0A5C3P663_9APHY|nr:hypothetical protein K466DRAFT_237840 [Polyporus arcularius HHB13444]
MRSTPRAAFSPALCFHLSTRLCNLSLVIAWATPLHRKSKSHRGSPSSSASASSKRCTSTTTTIPARRLLWPRSLRAHSSSAHGAGTPIEGQALRACHPSRQVRALELRGAPRPVPRLGVLTRQTSRTQNSSCFCSHSGLFLRSYAGYASAPQDLGLVVSPYLRIPSMREAARLPPWEAVAVVVIAFCLGRG